jgi:hypothetical protein
MAAREDQPQAVVGELLHVCLLFLELQCSTEQLALLGEAALAAQPVDRAVAGRGQDPRGGAGGHAGRRPALRRHRECVLHRLLGEVEIAEEADEGGDRPSRLAPEQAVEILARSGYEALAAAAYGSA